MAFTSGVFNTTTNFVPAELPMRSFAAAMLRLFPNGSAPIFALTSQIGRSKAKSSTHGYFSKTMTFFSNAINNGAGYNTAATVFVLDSTAGLTANSVVYNTRTRENYRVVSVDSATQITVTRAFGRTVATALLDNDPLIAVGTAFAEGSTRPTARGLKAVYVPNYTQIFRNAWGLTDTARASMMELGFSNVAENRQDCALLHSSDIEAAIIWGQPKMDTSGTQPIHATQGILDAVHQYANANYQTAAATTTFDQLVALMEPFFAYSTDIGNPMERVAFCDSKAMRILNEIGRKSGQVTITLDKTAFGMRFTAFNFYKGTVYLIEHPLMNGLNPNAGDMIVLDMPALKLAYMDGRDTKPEEYGTGGKLVESGTDGVGGSLTTEFAVELVNPFSCGYVKALTASA